MVTTDTDMVAGGTFLLVHGIGMGTSYFAQLNSALESQGRMVAIDLPGFGDAPEPANALTMAEMGAVLINFVEVEGLGKQVLVGHSMGTQVVAEAAAQRPDLFPEDNGRGHETKLMDGVCVAGYIMEHVKQEA